MSEKELHEICPRSESTTIEEKFDYKGKMLAVSVCSFCDYFDWIVPEGVEDSESKEFEDSQEWAKKKAEELRKKHQIVTIPVHYSENVKDKQTFQIDNLLNNLCQMLGYEHIYVGKFGRGIRIEMH